VATRTKDSKQKKQEQREREPKAGKPPLKDLDAEPDKASDVRGGPASCRVSSRYGGC
jgi:hypothetical protein